MTITAGTATARGPMTFSDWAQLLLLGAIWGGSFFFARIAVSELHPLVLVLFRVAIAALAGIYVIDILATVFLIPELKGVELE